MINPNALERKAADDLIAALEHELAELREQNFTLRGDLASIGPAIKCRNGCQVIADHWGEGA